MDGVFTELITVDDGDFRHTLMWDGQEGCIIRSVFKAAGMATEEELTVSRARAKLLDWAEPTFPKLKVDFLACARLIDVEPD